MTDLSTESLGYRRIFSEIDCCVCLEKKTDEYLTPCGHPICSECMNNLQKKYECPLCKTQFVGTGLQPAPAVLTAQMTFNLKRRLRGCIFFSSLSFLIALIFLSIGGALIGSNVSILNRYCSNPAINQSCGIYSFKFGKYIYSTVRQVGQNNDGSITYEADFYFTIIPDNRLLQCDSVQSKNFVSISDMANNTYAPNQIVPMYLNDDSCMVFNKNSIATEYNNAQNVYNLLLGYLIFGSIVLALGFFFCGCASHIKFFLIGRN